MNYSVVYTNAWSLSKLSKQRTHYQCVECGASSLKWSGQCPECEAWNTLVEVVVQAKEDKRSGPAHLAGKATVTTLSNIKTTETERWQIGIGELDRVLGGGLVKGSVTLIGGDPGIGKSTLLLQTLERLTTQQSINNLYVTGEESPEQVGLRGKRLALNTEGLLILAENNLERIIATTTEERPEILIIDSIQTLYTNDMQSAPGSVSQVRECAAQLVRFAKQDNVSVILVGHVTKEGALAGPRVLEHMVDTVLYFEGDSDSRHRVVRAVKNRFGAVNELGIFAMTEKGLKAVNNPSAIFLSRQSADVPGSAIMVTRQGTRPMLVEVQALVDSTQLANPRRLTIGLEQNRLSMLLAVLHRHGGIVTGDQDVYVNIVGGIKVTETAVDLPIIMAIVSSLKNRPIPEDMVIFGEVGLSGEVRPIQNGQERIKEASKHGFKQVVIPKANVSKQIDADITVHGVERLEDVLSLI